MKISLSLRVLLVALPLAAVSCQATPEFDYSNYVEHQPKSILVLPPLDQTLEVDASYGSLSTLTRPLVERGFYVFPAALVDAVMRSNGLPGPSEMHQVPLSKLREIFGADAVLYVTVKNWGSSYQVLNAQSAVTLTAVLIDTETGSTLWSGERTQVHNSSSSNHSSLFSMLAVAVVEQVANSISDPSRQMSAQAAQDLFASPAGGLLPGPYHPDHEQALADTQLRIAEARAGAE